MILSPWHNNQFRTNPTLENHWTESRFNIHTHQHFYHVGSRESLRHPMIEALITNFPTSANLSIVGTNKNLDSVSNPLDLLE
ncbi:MAG: hypothetical protein ACK4XH_21545 [Microcystis sp.]|uniref:hypothetical protein n=1 Tax=Microcystis sp. TaxID=1127 RepID=UPI00391965F1